ncbi:MAG: diguanylate cyclase, partial [Campylobacterales bacterium]|nr:diguanylate cyclase [Campylobacterales bacterium]
MIIIDTKILDAEKFAEKLRESIQGHSFKTVNKITCSFGVVECRKNDNFDTILKRVDTMLYSAKNSGRNCVVMVN